MKSAPIKRPVIAGPIRPMGIVSVEKPPKKKPFVLRKPGRG
jgi:hypothetical protein